MIVVTGASGFIGSCLIRRLNDEGLTDLVLVDDQNSPAKAANISGKKYNLVLSVEDFPKWFEENAGRITTVFHMGACSSTVEFDKRVFDRLNRNYSKRVWEICAEHRIPLLYASSGATYGDGQAGYSDDHANLPNLKPLNPYGQSKHDFDLWALEQKKAPPRWYGFKFFNVYGPNEQHKGRMASMVYHGYNQIKETGGVRLFRSHKPGFADGGQLRDFVYVKDVIDVCMSFKEHAAPSGLYNVGTGKARSFLDMQLAIFSTLKIEPKVTFVDIPEDIRDKYQYFTEAPLEKLRQAGYTKKFHSLEEGVKDYVGKHLVPDKNY